MNKNFFPLVLALLLSTAASAQIIITEIMYNPPEPNTDILEYIELYNNSANTVDVSGWSFNKGVIFTFPAGTSILPGKYAIISEDTAYFRARFPSIFPFQWSNDPVNSALTNSGETISLVNAASVLIDSVRYTNVAPWPTGANGSGASIVLCNFNADNNDAANWQAATTPTGVTSGGLPVFANPNAASGCGGVVSYPLYTIEQVTQETANGVADSINVTCTLEGVVHGLNQNPAGLQFALINTNNVGITVFLGSGNLNYTVLQGDKLRVEGRVNQFNGLTQFTPDGILKQSANNATVTPAVVLKPNEARESSLIRINNLRLVNPAEWTGGGNFNARAVSDANLQDTILIRVDNDVEVVNHPVPVPPFDIIGLGGQFDASSPFTSGYQILPQFNADIIEMVGTQQVDWSNEVLLSPNPAADWINLQTTMAFDHLVITDAQGRLVMRIAQPQQFTQLPIGDLAAGVYAFRFEAGRQFWSTQVIKK
ncbi:MAG: lamin tail domain-containing protein [Saprospiraceae bacterium]